MIAAANLLSFVGDFLGGRRLLRVHECLSPDGGGIFLDGAILTLVMTIYAIYLLPDSLLRLVLWMATHSIYRIRVEGRENIPETRRRAFCGESHVAGGCVLLIASTDRPIRFLMFKGIYDLPLVKPFAKMIRAIPISSELRPREMLQSLARGEQRDSRRRSGLHFCRGANHAHRAIAAVPSRDGADYEGSGCADRARKSRRRVGQHFQLRARAFLVEDAAVDSLSGDGEFRQADAVRLRRRSKCARRCRSCRPTRIAITRNAMRTLPRRLIRTAHRHPLRFAMGDKRRPRMRWGMALLGAIFLARRLRRTWAGQEMVGILLPPSVPGALVNFAAVLCGQNSGQFELHIVERDAGFVRASSASSRR